MSQPVKFCLNIVRRTAPGDIEDNLERLVALRPELDEELWQRVDTPLQVQTDPTSGKDFCLCDYNRDGDSYRSPWTNQYIPQVDDEGFRPSPQLRDLEVEANAVFDVYRHLYFEGGVSSVYMWDLEQNDGFAACFCIQKDAEGDKKLAGFRGSWSSVHVFEVIKQSRPDTYDYRLTSTVLVSMPIESEDIGKVDLSGSITKQAEKLGNQLKTIGDNKQSHMEVMGPMLEDLELDLRSSIEGVYFQKTSEVIHGMRVTDPELKRNQQAMANIGAQAANRS